MNIIQRALEKLGLIPHDVPEDHSTKAALQEHRSAVSAIENVLRNRVHSNEALRSSIEAAKARTASFGEFELSIQGRPPHHVD